MLRLTIRCVAVWSRCRTATAICPDLNDYRRTGVAVNALLSTDFDVQKINAMPRMTAVPVAVTAAVLHNSDIRDQERPGVFR